MLCFMFKAYSIILQLCEKLINVGAGRGRRARARAGRISFIAPIAHAHYATVSPAYFSFQVKKNLVGISSLR